jgi:hypothetical protein
LRNPPHLHFECGLFVVRSARSSFPALRVGNVTALVS